MSVSEKRTTYAKDAFGKLIIVILRPIGITRCTYTVYRLLSWVLLLLSNCAHCFMLNFNQNESSNKLNFWIQRLSYLSIFGNFWSNEIDQKTFLKYTCNVEFTHLHTSAFWECSAKNHRDQDSIYILGANSITYLANLVIWLIQIWIFTNARHTVQRKADNLDSSDTWSGKNAQVVDFSSKN